ncbi:hypothetical protein GCM10027598_60920 [Amycolatopsis oliviviridis]|uniref:Uncharacterized protein n=1 Tax=Amycolatopsis oliviviridis TaxID=1471590 RepID=A0ABQ3M5S5_9PSEU|nr:hypothetical protein [Amycolatopsis oliviviridis]GHH32306.1 hypothetical protein GCM10017790_69220 [Amycolatopsis oliviviridis]
MPNPTVGPPGEKRELAVPAEPKPAHALKDEEIALELPEWNLLPLAEFLERHKRT